MSSTRVKDLVDLVLIASTKVVGASALRSALDETFASRTCHRLPEALPPPPASWEVPYAKLATEVSIDRAVLAGYRVAAHFLDPVLSMVAPQDSRWNPVDQQWAVDT